MCCEYYHPCKCPGAPKLCPMCDEDLPIEGEQLCQRCMDSCSDTWVEHSSEIPATKLSPIEGCECGCGGDRMENTNANV